MNTTIRYRARLGVAVAVLAHRSHRHRPDPAAHRRGRRHYHVGELAYWPPGNEIAIFYADDRQTIPQPGLVRLGTIDSGLEVIAAAGNDFEMTIQPLD